MDIKIIKLEFQVECDQCGLMIHAGERCRLIIDESACKVDFEHLRCPGAPAVVVDKPQPKNPQQKQQHISIYNLTTSMV